jgi:hypothetical protein
MKKLTLPILIATMILCGASVLWAQTDLSDTMSVPESFGAPGDTVLIQLDIANHDIAVGGYSARLVFDSSILQAISADTTHRGSPLELTAGNSPQDTVFVILAYSMRFPPGFIARGSGPVVMMKFKVKSTATPGSSTPIRFVDNIPNAVNGLSDSLGINFIYPVKQDGNFSVTGGNVNQPPRIINIGPQQVREGQTLQFPVTAYDLDGDPITLSAQSGSLPLNAVFQQVQGDSVATGIFTFSPDFTQGPDTFDVVFVAQDDNNNTTSMTVPIVVLEQPNDLLSVDLNQGGVPGATGRPLSVKLFNTRPVYGVQFDYQYDPSQITITDVVPTARCTNMGFWFNSPDPGKIIVLIFSPGLDTIGAGSDAIVNFMIDVNLTAHPGRTDIVLDSALEVIDSIGTTRNSTIESGYFTVDRYGDANLDTLVNVGDCVKIVSFIIEMSDLTIRQFDASDINRDTRVNVADLQMVIDTILEIQTPPIFMPPGPAASVELLKDQIPTADVVQIPLWADIGLEASAVQYEITYNSNHLEAIDVQTGEMISGMQVSNNLGVGKINGVVYNIGTHTFGPAAGEMANFAFRVKGGSYDPVHDISLSQFLIVNQAASFISTEIKGRIPDSYMLNQNYPNPFNATTNISFDLPNDGNVELSIYDLLGRKIVTLINSFLPAGSHTLTWNGRSQTGETVATGIFFYRLRAADFDETKKMTLIK